MLGTGQIGPDRIRKHFWYVAGLMPERDAAAISRDRKRMVEILGEVGLASQADQIADAVLANPKRYGF
jgi:hypothetical protein